MKSKPLSSFSEANAFILHWPAQWQLQNWPRRPLITKYFVFRPTKCTCLSLCLLNLLATYSEFKSKTVCHLYFTEEGFTHIKNGNWSRVTDTIPQNMRSKIAQNGAEQHLPLPELLNHKKVIIFKHFDIYLLQETHLPDVQQGKLWENQ